MIERLHARGPRGESCIIIRESHDVDSSNLSGKSALSGLASYRLATGERLNPTDDPRCFVTVDGKRKYELT